MPTNVKKVIMPVLSLGIVGAWVYFSLVPAPFFLCLAVLIVCVELPAVVARGMKNTSMRLFLWRITFYFKLTLALFAGGVVITHLWMPACDKYLWILYSNALFNAVLYTIDLFCPGRLPLKEPAPNNE